MKTGVCRYLYKEEKSGILRPGMEGAMEPDGGFKKFDNDCDDFYKLGGLALICLVPKAVGGTVFLFAMMFGNWRTYSLSERLASLAISLIILGLIASIGGHFLLPLSWWYTIGFSMLYIVAPWGWDLVINHLPARSYR